ncbi:hypothetical protein H4R24_004839 [Coemansia sp. RSA 988]|nr:hypothetical protein H4R24_004839 [Coemansia sp. RSA 988]
MDRPAGHVPATQQQGTASLSSIQNILVYNRPSSPPLQTQQPLPSVLQNPQQQQQQCHYPLGQPDDPAASHGPSADTRQYATASEPDYTREEGVPPVADANLRRRSINSSKRAAQNRAAQRAFRLRRERYVAGLEEKARNYDRLETAYLDIQRENYQLRTSLHKLQSEASVLRTHVATSAPVSPSPPSGVSGTLLPITMTPPIANTMPHYPGLRPVALTDSANYYQYYQYTYHYQNQKTHQHHYQHQQQQQHPQRQIQSEHPPLPHSYISAINLTLEPSSTGLVHAQMASLATQPLPLPPPPRPSTSLSTKHQSNSPDAIQYQQNLMPSRQSRFRHDHLPPGTLNLEASMTNMTPTIGLHSTTHPASEISNYSTVKIQSPVHVRDGACEMDIVSPTIGSASHRQHAIPVSVNTALSASAAPVLPSVREITQSIDAMHPSSPHMGCASTSRLNKSCTGTAANNNSHITESVNSKRRPW